MSVKSNVSQNTEEVKSMDAGVKKTTAAKRTGTKKAALKNTLHVQYAGKSFSQDDLLKMAKTAWRQEHKRKVGDLTSVDLYVKPEENTVYYVMNGDVTGSFTL